MKNKETRAVDFGDITLIFTLTTEETGTKDPMMAQASQRLTIHTPKRSAASFRSPVFVAPEQAAATTAEWRSQFLEWEAKAGDFHPWERDLDPKGRDLEEVGSVGRGW